VNAQVQAKVMNAALGCGCSVEPAVDDPDVDFWLTPCEGHEREAASTAMVNLLWGVRL
jgi:hypothetical protein